MKIKKLLAGSLLGLLTVCGIVQAGVQNPAYNNTPYLSTYPSTSETLSGTAAVLQFNTTTYDTCSCYNTSTYTYTPKLAGKYLVTADVLYTATLSAADAVGALQVYKNGAAVFTVSSAQYQSSATMYMPLTLSYIVNMNGSTDYIQLYGALTGGTSPALSSGASSSVFQIFYLGP